MTASPAFAGFHHVVWPLAIGQTIIWAAIFYSFPALLPTWEQDLGWSKAALSGALTMAVLTSAAASPLFGRLIDRGWGLQVMLSGTIVSAGLLVLHAHIDSLWQFYALWIALGFTMAGVLYEPCFAILTIAMGQSARRAITLISLVAGFAGTVSFPSAHILVGLFGWRGCLLVMAAAIICLALPTFWYGLSALRRLVPEKLDSRTAKTDSRISPVLRQPTFWFLAFAFAAIALNHGMILMHLLPLLAERGIATATAVTAASFIGPMQVVGRLLMLAGERWLSSIHLTAVSFCALIISGLALLNAGAAPHLIVLFVTCQGAGIGILSIMRPVVTAELLGRENFGTVAGLLAVGYLIAFALAPSVAAAIWRLAGYDTMIVTAILTAVIGLICTLLASRRGSRR